MKKIILIALVVLLVSSSAWGGFISGTYLSEVCNTPESSNVYYQDNAACGMYIVGACDTYESEKIGNICVPNNVSQGQLQKVVTKHLNNNPELLHWPANYLVRAALERAFPCN